MAEDRRGSDGRAVEDKFAGAAASTKLTPRFERPKRSFVSSASSFPRRYLESPHPEPGR